MIYYYFFRIDYDQLKYQIKIVLIDYKRELKQQKSI